MQQAEVCNYCDTEMLYNFFEHLNVVKWKKIKTRKL